MHLSPPDEELQHHFVAHSKGGPVRLWEHKESVLRGQTSPVPNAQARKEGFVPDQRSELPVSRDMPLWGAILRPQLPSADRSPLRFAWPQRGLSCGLGKGGFGVTSDVTFEGNHVLRGLITLRGLVVSPMTVRPPLTVAHGPSEVPPWDWTRGFPPQVDWPWEKSLFLKVGPYRPVPEGLQYPRLVRKHFGQSTPPRLRFPLYRHVAKLGTLALKEEPYSSQFVRKALAVAQQVGLLYPPLGSAIDAPSSSGDSMVEWHDFSLRVRAYLDFLRLYRQDPVKDLDTVIRDLKGQIASGYRGIQFWLEREKQEREPLLVAEAKDPYTQVLEEIEKAYKKIDPPRLMVFGSGSTLMGEPDLPGGLRGLALRLLTQWLPHLLKNIDWGYAVNAIFFGEGSVVRSYVGAAAWIYIEIGALYTSQQISTCPVCGTPFVGRKNQFTCGTSRCRQAKRRNKRRETPKDSE